LAKEKNLKEKEGGGRKIWAARGKIKEKGEFIEEKELTRTQKKELVIGCPGWGTSKI